MIFTRYSSITELIKDKEVLEVGCGSGLGLGYIDQYAQRVVGCDYSSSNIEIAQKHYQSRVEVLLIDAHDLPFISDSFDTIVAMEVLHYLNVAKFLLECSKVLRKNSMILACMPNKDRIGFSPSKLSRNYFSVPELYSLFQDHNFKLKICGAFKVKKKSSDEEPWNKSKKHRVISNVGRILRTVPGGSHFKNFLGKKLFKKIELPSELKPEMVEAGELIPLNPDVPNDEYKILYVFAVKNN